MLQHLVNIFNKFPAQYKSIFKYTMQPFALKILSLETLIDDLFVPIYMVNGQSNLKVVFIGHDAVITYLTNRLYNEKRGTKLLRKIFIGKLNREIN